MPPSLRPDDDEDEFPWIEIVPAGCGSGMILLDTNVLSAFRKPGRHPQVRAWLGAQREVELYLSAITVGELERGRSF